MAAANKFNDLSLAAYTSDGLSTAKKSYSDRLANRSQVGSTKAWSFAEVLNGGDLISGNYDTTGNDSDVVSNPTNATISGSDYLSGLMSTLGIAGDIASILGGNPVSGISGLVNDTSALVAGSNTNWQNEVLTALGILDSSAAKVGPVEAWTNLMNMPTVETGVQLDIGKGWGLADELAASKAGLTTDPLMDTSQIQAAINEALAATGQVPSESLTEEDAAAISDALFGDIANLTEENNTSPELGAEVSGVEAAAAEAAANAAEAASTTTTTSEDTTTTTSATTDDSSDDGSDGGSDDGSDGGDSDY